jgi:hypothetical protein
LLEGAAVFRYFTAIAVVFVLVACGGAPPAATQAPGGGQSPTAEQPTSVAPPPDDAPDVLTTGDIATSVEALEALGSWTFDLTYFIEGLDEGVEKRVSGTERRGPEMAVHAVHEEESGDFNYIRIEDDVWTDVGMGNYSHAVASDSPNLVVQYEPYHLPGLIETSTGWRRAVEYDFVGQEEVNGTAVHHYTLNEYDREGLTERTDLQPEQWAGDVYLAATDGHLVRFVWGPQSIETAQQVHVLGFAYDVTSVNCDCPVEPPD